eukprot:gene14259-30336_t
MNHISNNISIGCEAKTAYGWGVVTQVDKDRIVVEFDEWELNGASKPVLYTTRESLLEQSYASIGTCIQTRYGNGVLIRYDRKTGFHTVRLWSLKGLGSGIAFIKSTDIIKQLKAFRGANVSTIYGKGIVEYHRERDNIYVIRLAFGLAYLDQDSFQCVEATVLPIIVELTSKISGGITYIDGVVTEQSRRIIDK